MFSAMQEIIGFTGICLIAALILLGVFGAFTVRLTLTDVRPIRLIGDAHGVVDREIPGRLVVEPAVCRGGDYQRVGRRGEHSGSLLTDGTNGKRAFQIGLQCCRQRRSRRIGIVRVLRFVHLDGFAYELRAFASSVRARGGHGIEHFRGGDGSNDSQNQYDDHQLDQRETATTDFSFFRKSVHLTIILVWIQEGEF